ncbi:DoxX family membrane protein [Prosthecobacter fluviatilis]|uniref:DoxX family membrane protein n=1 Tax=Prosthecobacter fluviatilis TaxID=445931 RepID=A0ABW0KVW6_9BACT
MKHIPTIARLLLGLIFVVFGFNMWFHYIDIPLPKEGTPAANFMFSIFGSGYLDVVKVLEVTGGLLLLSGRFTNLALTLVGPVVVNIALYHFFLVKGGYEMPVVLGVLSLVALSGRKDYLSTLFAAK